MSDAIVPMPRHPSQIFGELLAAQKEVEVLREELGKFAALDCRPMVFRDDQIEHVGEFKIPDVLRDAYREAFERMKKLELEMYDRELYGFIP